MTQAPGPARSLVALALFAALLGSARGVVAGAAPPAASSPEAAAVPAPPDVAAAPADAEVTTSGLASKVLAPGTGTTHPLSTDLVKVRYTGWKTDGTVFDSSRGKAALLPLDRVIAGWSEGVALMIEGEKRRLWVPEALAYHGRADRPQGMLVFDVELLEILRVPPTPPDVAAAPADAARTPSGLASKVLAPGTGAAHATRTSAVRVRYTGWTTDGRMFDSSIPKGAPALFRLDKVIPGWTEGIPLMVEGETRRFWIPKKLAYRGQEGMPEGTLVFEVTLVEIVTP